MFKHILVPTDGSKLSDKAVKRAVAFSKETKSKLVFLHVTPEFRALLNEGYLAASGPILRKRMVDDSAALSRKVLGAATAAAQAAGVASESVSVSNDAPYEEIVKQAKKRKCDLIMMASHGRRGISSLLLGSETTKVLTHSTVPVLVYR